MVSMRKLVHYVCPIGADCEIKVVASSREMVHALLYFRFSVAVESAAISKEEFSQCGYPDRCVCFESSEVEHYHRHSVANHRESWMRTPYRRA